MIEWIRDFAVSIGLGLALLLVYLLALVLFVWAIDRTCKQNAYCDCRKCTQRAERKALRRVAHGHLLGVAKHYRDQADDERSTSQDRDDALAMARWLDQTVVNRARPAGGPHTTPNPERPQERP